MPALIGVLLRAIGWSVVPLGWKLLRGLGFAAVSYVGIKTVLEFAKDYAFSQLASVPVEWIQMMGLLKVDVCLNILFSSYIARAVLSGMDGSGSKTSVKWLGK